MIPFFRKIRRWLIAENKFSRYLLYAAGEIILVVAGILIALSINNWNEAKKEHKIETEILNEILSNLDSDIKNLDECIASTEEWIFQNNEVLQHLNNNSPLTDTLRRYYVLLIADSPFYPNKLGYKNLNSLGMNIIRNEQLRNEISMLYENKYYFFVEDRKRASDIWQERILDQLSEKLEYIKPWEAEPINLEELRHNIQFKNVVLNHKTMLEWTIDRYNQGKKEIQVVMQSIRDELNK